MPQDRIEVPTNEAEANIRAYAERHGIDPDLLLDEGRMRRAKKNPPRGTCPQCLSSRTTEYGDWSHCDACGNSWKRKGTRPNPEGPLPNQKTLDEAA